MPHLEIYKHDEFPSGLNWQAVSFMRVEWPHIEGGYLRETYSADLHPIHFAVVEDDLLISYATVLWLPINHAKASYSLYGLGNVFTFPSFRGSGFGRQVVEAATQYIKRTDGDVAALFCDPSLEQFYARSGWETIHPGTTLTGEEYAPVALDGLRMMLFLSDRGSAARAAFMAQPLYVRDSW